MLIRTLKFWVSWWTTPDQVTSLRMENFCPKVCKCRVPDNLFLKLKCREDSEDTSILFSLYPSILILMHIMFTKVIILKGHFHSCAKSRDHEIIRPQKNAKAIPRHLQNHVVWSWTLKCSVKSSVTGPSIKCYFNDSLFCRVLTHDTIT